ncbi:MAG: hypothetical protein ACOYXN_01950 [Acidobacteriota bacterium]
MARTPGRTLVLALAALVPALAAGAQELSTFLSAPPPPGSWAKYRIETRGTDWTKRRPFNLAVTGKEPRENVPHVYVEAGPTKFAGYHDGTLRLLLKAAPSPEEGLNPFLTAQEVAYAKKDGETFRLSDGALGFLHRQAAEVKTSRTAEELGEEPVVALRGKTYACKKVRLATTTEASFLGDHYKVVETGTYWLSEEAPFKVVKAEIERRETRDGKEKVRHITISLKVDGLEGAPTAFPRPVTQEKGLLGLLFQ